ncbi:dTDP-4-dehydrorhamnose 3,5-epimerase [Hyphomicrobium sp. 1Nfss2.1]|uniref:dTDP-4-dehydrorhamnose 3,5-epimerase n=1 Tax=Hyphomicrobium sp. 1Nfss2.1 TaxID=3413936 RepID=UPI003C7A3CC6
MLIRDTELADAKLIELQPHGDERGFFARTFCEREFAAHGLETSFVQHSTSFSATRGTLRGMHFQRGAAAEVKVVSCVRGAIYDVIIDLRAGRNQGRWQGFELTADNRNRLYIPKGFAHGFQTLTDDVEVSYLISEFYAPDTASGVRYDDPAFAIRWPLAVTTLSEKDKSWPDFAAVAI